jgi:hypothetical protein
MTTQEKKFFKESSNWYSDVYLHNYSMIFLFAFVCIVNIISIGFVYIVYNQTFPLVEKRNIVITTNRDPKLSSSVKKLDPENRSSELIYEIIKNYIKAREEIEGENDEAREVFSTKTNIVKENSYENIYLDFLKSQKDPANKTSLLLNLLTKNNQRIEIERYEFVVKKNIFQKINDIFLMNDDPTEAYFYVTISKDDLFSEKFKIHIGYDFEIKGASQMIEVNFSVKKYTKEKI